MSDTNTTKFQALWFSKYRDMLQEKLTCYEIILNEFNPIEEVGEEISKNDLYNASVNIFGGASSDDSKKTMHTEVLRNKQWISTICSELISLAQKEIEELSNLLGTVTIEEISARNQIRSLLSNYQSQRVKNEKQLNQILPGIFKLAEQEYGILQQTIKHSAEEFVEFFTALVKSLRDETIDKGSLFINFYEIIVNLHKYHPELHDLSISNFRELLSHMGKGDDAILAKCFVENFRGNKDLINGVKNWAEKTKVTSQDTSKGYDSLEKEDQEGLDKYMQSKLEMLFKKCTDGNTDRNLFEDIAKQIKKLVKAPEDMNKLKDAFEEVKVKLQDAIKKQNKNFKLTSGGFNAIQIADQDSNIMKIKDFDKNYLSDEKNKANITFVINELENIIDNKKTFKDFLEMNSSLFRENSKDTEDDDEKLSSTSQKEILDCLAGLYKIGLEIENNILSIDSIADRSEFILNSRFKLFIKELFGEFDEEGKSKNFDKSLNTFKTKENKNQDDIDRILKITKNVDSSNVDDFWKLFSQIFIIPLETK